MSIEALLDKGAEGEAQMDAPRPPRNYVSSNSIIQLSRGFPQLDLLQEEVEDLITLESLGYGTPKNEEVVIWLNNYDNMVVQAAETNHKGRLKYWRLWKRELEPYEIDYWMSLFKRMWRAQMNGVVENRLGLKP